jgi:predicted benzoate:H+ symporter BenE
MKTFTTLLVVILWIIFGNYLLVQNFSEVFWQVVLRVYIFTTAVLFSTGVYNTLKEAENEILHRKRR